MATFKPKFNKNIIITVKQLLQKKKLFPPFLNIFIFFNMKDIKFNFIL